MGQAAAALDSCTLHAWTGWVRQQPAVVRIGVIALTGAVLLATLWLVNAFGLVAGWVGLHGDWVQSPLT